MIKFLGVTSNDRIIRVLKHALRYRSSDTRRFAMIIIVPLIADELSLRSIAPFHVFSFYVYYIQGARIDFYSWPYIETCVVETTRNFVVIYPWIEMKSNVTFEGVTGSRVKRFVQLSVWVRNNKRGGLCPVLDYFHPKFARFR